MEKCGSFYAVAYCLHGFGSIVPLLVRVTANLYKVILSYYCHHMLKHLHPDVCGLFQDDNVTIHSPQRVTDCFSEDDIDSHPISTQTSLGLIIFDQLDCTLYPIIKNTSLGNIFWNNDISVQHHTDISKDISNCVLSIKTPPDLSNLIYYYFLLQNTAY